MDSRPWLWHTWCDLDMALSEKGSCCSWRWSPTCQKILMLFSSLPGEGFMTSSFPPFKSKPLSEWSCLICSAFFRSALTAIPSLFYKGESFHCLSHCDPTLWDHVSIVASFLFFITINFHHGCLCLLLGMRCGQTSRLWLDISTSLPACDL